MKFQYLLFDWDGCLVDTLPIWFQAMKKGLSIFKIETSDANIKKGFQTWDIFTKLGVTDMVLFTHKVYEHVCNNLSEIEFNDGVIEVLIKIKKSNRKAAIVSSTEQSKIIPVLERMKAVDLFEYIIGRNDVDKLKPNPEAIEKAIFNINGKNDKAVMIGDSPVDIAAGKNANISTIWYSSKSNQNYHTGIHASQIEPDIIINHMIELEDII